jgi:betaine-aldehyde dehydrogenase
VPARDGWSRCWRPARLAGGGYFYRPTVIDGVRTGDELVTTEIFGPVITVETFTDEDDAIARANATE